jgi:hypothetical protein
MQKLPTGMQRRPPAPHQAAIERIRREGRAARALQALDLHAKYMGLPAREPDEGAPAFRARLARLMRGQGTQKQEGNVL